MPPGPGGHRRRAQPAGGLRRHRVAGRGCPARPAAGSGPASPRRMCG